ncbi:MAG: cyclic nucleotide-binding domain-containing protein [Candidatus Binatia bacterium]
MSEHLQPHTEEDRLRLAAHRLLHELEEEPRDALISRFFVEEVPLDHVLLEESHSNSRLFVILKGSVSVKLPRDEHRVSEVKLATLGPGDMFGEYSLFDRHPVSATVYATEPTRVAWLEKAAMDEFFHEHGESGRRFYEAIAKVLVARLRAKDAELDVVTIG